MVPVIDISRHQGTVDFKVMASRGVKGVILRAGNGLKPDDRFEQYVPAAKAAGLKVGSYWFCNPKASPAPAQAALLADAHNRHHLDLPPMLDVENYNAEGGNLPHLAGPPFAAWLRQFANTVEVGSRRPFFYSNAAYWNPNVGATDFGTYDIIVARYPFYSVAQAAKHVPPVDAGEWADWVMAETRLRPQVPVGWTDYAGWQFAAGYNGRGHIYGCSSADLDLNIIRDDVWARWLGTIPPVVESEPPTVVAPNPQRQVTAALAAATQGDDMLKIVGNSDNKADPTRWAWNGLVMRRLRNERDYALLVALKLTGPDTTLASPVWMTGEELATYANV